MARPVVAAAPCVEAIDATAGTHLLGASTAEDYIREVSGLLADRARGDRIGTAGRAQVLAVYGWDARLADLDRFMADAADAAAGAAQALPTPMPTPRAVDAVQTA